MMRAVVLVAVCGVACGPAAVVDDDGEDAEPPDTEVSDTDADVSDTGGGPDDTDGFPDPVTFLEDPLPGAWSDAFSLPGVGAGGGARVQALAELPDGRLVIGGAFGFVGPVAASNVAVREASGAWGPLAEGVDFQVEDLLRHEDDLWVVGWSPGADGPLGQVARWDGSAWSRPAVDLDGRVYGVDLVGGVVHVSGAFTSIGGRPADGLAAASGLGWRGFDDLFAEGEQGTLRSAFPGPDGSLCVSGAFASVAGLAAGGVACLGEGWGPWGSIEGDVYGVAQLGNGRWMAWGVFAVPGPDGDFSVGLGTWSGSAWVAPAEGGVFSGAVVSEVRALWPRGPSGYAIAGQFDSVGSLKGRPGTASRFLATFDGSAWASGVAGPSVTSAVSSGGSVGGYALLERDGVLWLGGLFHAVDGQTAIGLGGWDGSGWVQPFDLSIGRGRSAHARDVAVGIDGSVWLIEADVGLRPSLLRWTGSDWEQPAFAPEVRRGGALHRVDGIVHLAGELEVDRTPCDVAAHVGPRRWRCVLTGLGGAVDLLGHDDDGHLVVAGGFTPDGGPSRVARWDGRSLAPLGAGITEGTIVRMAVAPDGRVALAGFGLRSGSTDLGAFALWEGSAWVPIGGVDGWAEDLAWYQGDLVVAGSVRFVTGPRAGLEVGSLPRWDGAAWSDFGGLLSGTGGLAFAWSVEPWGDGLFVSGAFDRVGTAPLGGVAWFDGTTWASLGRSGADDVVATLAVGADDVWIAGAFQQVDGVPSYGVARWVVGGP